jgi:hypothetical protein
MMKSNFRNIYLCGILCISFLTSGALSNESAPKPSVTDSEITALVNAVQDLVDTYGNDYPGGSEYLSQAKKMAADASSPKNKVTKQAFKKLQHRALTANPLLTAQPILYTVHALDKYGTHVYMRPNTYVKQGGELKLLNPATGRMRRRPISICPATRPVPRGEGWACAIVLG